MQTSFRVSFGTKPARARRTPVLNAFVDSGKTVAELESAQDKRAVVKLGDTQVLLQKYKEKVYAVSNRCPHLNLPLQGRTAILQAQLTDEGCIVCSAHKTAFDLESGEVKGEWCPGMPNLPLVGKMNNDKAPLPIYSVQVEESGAIMVDLSV